MNCKKMLSHPGNLEFHTRMAGSFLDDQSPQNQYSTKKRSQVEHFVAEIILIYKVLSFVP